MSIVIELEKPTEGRPQWKARVRDHQSIKSLAVSGDMAIRECQAKFLRELATKIAIGEENQLKTIEFTIVDL